MKSLLLLFPLFISHSTLLDNPTNLNDDPGKIERLEQKVLELFNFYLEYPNSCKPESELVNFYYFNYKAKTSDEPKHWIVRGRYGYKCSGKTTTTLFMLKVYEFENDYYIWRAEYSCDFSLARKGFDKCKIWLSPKTGPKPENF